MKFKYFIPVLATAMLVACGGKTNESKAPEASSKAPSTQESAKPSSTQGSQAPSSRPSSAPASNPSSAPASNPSSSETPAVKLTISATTLAKKADGKVYLTISGTVANAPANTKVAVGLQLGTAWLKGSETPAAADYNVALGNGGAFSVEINLSELQGLTDGTLKMYVGFDADSYKALTGLTDSTKIDDGNYYFYVSDYYGGIQLEKVPPIAFTETTIIKQDSKVYVKFGGLKAADVTLESMQSASSYIDFQRIGRYQLTKITNTEGQWDKYHYEVEGDKAYVLVTLDGLAAGSNYMMHFNYHADKAANFSVPAVNKNFVYNGKNYNLYCNPTATGESEFYGCLGFKVTDAAADATEGEQIEAHKVTFDVLEHAQLEVYMDDMYETKQTGTGNVYYTTAEGQYSKVYDLDEDVGAGLPFKVICDEGYGVKNIEITPATVDSQKTYKNIKTPENTKIANGYKITWIYTNIQVKVNVVSASELLPGRKVTFNVPTGAQLTVYKDKNFTVIDPTADYYLTRDSDGTPEADGGLPYSTGAKAAIYFKVLVPAGKTFTVTIDPKEAVNKSEAANAEIAGSWKITKITADINITIAIVDAPAA